VSDLKSVDDDFPGERFYNRYLFLGGWAVMIGLQLIAGDGASVIKLVVNGFAMVVASFFIGGALHLSVLPVFLIWLPEWRITSLLINYLGWVWPGIGFAVIALLTLGVTQ
jgi:uncharacterized protein (DUF983 family)